MKKNYFINAMLVLFITILGGSFNQVSAQNYFYVGTATTTTSGSSVPFYTFYHDKRSSYMILASELQAMGASGNILSLAVDVASPAAQAMNGFNIKMGQTTATSMSGFVAGLTTVYSAASHTASTGWNNFTFSTPFNWDGVSNVVVEICFDNSSWSSSSSMYYTATSFTSCYGQYADSWGGPGCTMTAGATASPATYRPNTRLEFSPPFPNDAAISALINPTFPTCAMDSVVKVEIKNFGTVNLTSATVNWSVNGNIQPANSWTGNLAPFAGDTVTLGTVTGGLNDGDVVIAWSSMPNSIPDSNNVNDTLSSTLYNSLSGTYVIDPSGAGDFVSFTDAVNAMDNYGICAATVFEVVDTTFVEQITLKTYTGMNDTNTVTFKSQSGNASACILAYSAATSADNFVVYFDGASYFSFEDMTLRSLGASNARVLVTPTSGGSHHITVDGCMIEGMVTTSTWQSSMYVTYIYGPGNDYWTLTNNTFLNGNYGLYFRGDYSAKGVGNVVEGNKFLDQYYQPVDYYYQENGKFNDNFVTSNSTLSYGYSITLGQLLLTEVKNNHILGTSSWPQYGMNIYGAQGDLSTFMPITGNRIIMPKIGASRGMYLSSGLFTEVAHNSIMINSTSNFSPTLYLTSGGYNKIKNNILINSGSGSVVRVSGSPVYQMDYNNLSAPNGVIGYTNTASADLAAWQAATGYDSNSVTVNDVISDTATFKVCTDSLYAKGVYLPMYAMDFEGDMRQDPPCIGADEFMPISEFGFDDNPVLCTGDTITITQGYYDTVVWNAIDTSNSLVVTTPGQVTVQVMDVCGAAADTFNVDPQPIPTLGDTNLCEGMSATLNTGISGGTYLWSNGSTDSTVTVDSAQTLSVQIVDMHGCNSTATSIVTQSMDVALNGVDSFCQGANVVLDAGITGTYTWNDGSSNQTLSVSAAGTYSVTVIDQNCTSFDTTVVVEILNAVPSYTDSSSYLTVVFTNTSQNATSYLWDFGDNTTSTVVSPTHIYPWTTDTVKLYTVTLTAYNSCGDNEFLNDGVRIGQAVSVTEIDLLSMISVYPNPNKGVFNVVVKTDEAAEMSVQVLDVRGSLVYTNSFGTVNGEVNRTINLEGAAQGIYFVRVTLNGETAVYRLSVN